MAARDVRHQIILKGTVLSRSDRSVHTFIYDSGAIRQCEARRRSTDLAELVAGYLQYAIVLPKMRECDWPFSPSLILSPSTAQLLHSFNDRQTGELESPSNQPGSLDRYDSCRQLVCATDSTRADRSCITL